MDFKDTAKAEDFGTGKTATSIVIEYITKQIIQKQLRSGDRVPTEIELCGTLNVSRSTVREAMKILVAMGIVEIRHGFGTFVSSSRTMFSVAPIFYKMILNDTSQQELLAFRSEIEQSVIKLCSKNATSDDIAEMAESLRDLEEFVKAGGAKDADTLLHKDVEFHRILARSTKNKIMEEIYILCLDLLMPLIKGQDGFSAVRGHALLLEAVKSGDIAFISRTVDKVIYDFWAVWVDLNNINK